MIIALVAPTMSVAASTKNKAESAARRDANHYTTSTFGIGGRPSDWTARCSRHSYGWGCSLNFNGGECRGTLREAIRPHGRFHAYRFRIGCME